MLGRTLAVGFRFGVVADAFAADAKSKVVGVDKTDGDAEAGQGMREEGIGAAIERGGGNDLVAC